MSVTGLEKIIILKNTDFFDLGLNQIFRFFKTHISAPRLGYTKFLKLVCLLNRINNMAAMLLLFPVIVSKQQLIRVSLPSLYM